MVRLNNTQSRVSFVNAVHLFEKFLWFAFLALLSISSFLLDGYASRAWLLFSSAYYAWLGFYIFIVCFGAPIGLRGLQHAKVVICLLLISLLWLLLQLCIPLQHSFYELLSVAPESNLAPPSWFNPNIRWSVTPLRTQWLFFSELLFFCVFVSVLMLVRSRLRLKVLLATLIFVGFIHIGIGFASKLSGIILVDIKELDGHFTAMRGLFVNRNHFGAFLSLCLSGTLAFQLYFISKNQSNVISQILYEQFLTPRVFVLLSLILSIIGIISSESRGVFLALTAAIVLIGLGHGLAVRKINFQAALILALVVLASIGYFGQVLIGRMVSDGIALGERALQWKWTFEAISENPIFGYGGGSYATVFQAFRPEGEFRQVIFAQSHNHYLHLWLERGLVGLILWVAIICVSLFSAIKYCKSHMSSFVKFSLAGCLIALVASLIQSLVDYNLQVLSIRLLFMVILAIIFVAPKVKHRPSKKQ